MAGSQKAASSTADSNKKTPSPDDPMEEDFLSSWKSKKSGKDTLDFGTETVPQDRKKAFDFDKLDDFELGEDFGKISSFKVDMSDLDFSSPHRKTEKPMERLGKKPVMGKKDEKMDTFSFTFDFNVLDDFDLCSNLLKGEKNTSKCADNEIPKSSVKIHKNQGSRSNSLTSSDILEKTDMKLLDDVACSQHLTDIQGKLDVASGVPCVPLPNRELHNNVSLKELSSPMKQINSTERSQNVSVGHTEQLEMTGSEKPLARQSAHDAATGDDSAQDTHSQFSAILTVEQENSVKAISTSHSRSSSPVSCNLKCSHAISMTESPSTDKHVGNTNEASRKSIAVNDTTVVNVGVEDASMTDASHKMLPKMGGNEEKQISSPRYPRAVLGRDSGYEKYMPLKGKGACALQLKPLNRSEATESQLHSSTSKQLYAIDNKKMETMRLSPVNENRESRNAKQPGNQKGNILKSLSRSVTKSGAIFLGNDRNEKDSYAFRTPNGISPKLLSSTASIKTFKAVPTEKHGTSMDVKRSCNISSMKISRVISSNSNPSNPTVEQESVECSERNVEIHLNTRPIVAHSLIMEKRALLSPPLKRKSLEGPNTDPRYLSLLKRVSKSPVDSRKSLKASTKVDGQVVPRIENLDEGCYDVCLDHQNSSIDVPVEAKETELRIPVLIENDGNAEKAESCTKALEDICNMLKKKHEEAKELLVRAIVNNNTLLMLNHPMHEEKIRAVQKFASSLPSMVTGFKPSSLSCADT